VTAVSNFDSNRRVAVTVAEMTLTLKPPPKSKKHVVSSAAVSNYSGKRPHASMINSAVGARGHLQVGAGDVEGGGKLQKPHITHITPRTRRRMSPVAALLPENGALGSKAPQTRSPCFTEEGRREGLSFG
jgi:hypothetical protein